MSDPSSPLPRHSGTPKPRRGRRRGFDRAEALEQAMRLFWDRGYEGTSYEALTDAMGLSASSLQNAFESKEALFKEALRAYVSGPTAWFDRALDAPLSTRAAFELLLEESATTFDGTAFPPGCMISLAAIHVGPGLGSIRHFASELRQQTQDVLAQRIRRGIEEDDVPASADPEALAAFFVTVFRGIAVQARDGASRQALRTIGQVAMRCWPD